MYGLSAFISILMIMTIPANAHSAERGYVLLLPTGFIIAGGALAVAASFLLMTRATNRRFLDWSQKHLSLPWRNCECHHWTSILSGCIVALLLLRGFTGTADPLENPLTLSVWTGWWIIIVLLHPILGDLWSALNPLGWTKRIFTHTRYPESLSYWPALVLFACFAWFQLAHTAPDHPPTLATVILCYFAVTLLGTAFFGARPWFQFADPFAVLFRLLGAAAPVQKFDGKRLSLSWPATNLESQVLPISGALFVIATLSTIAYDALASSYWWLALWGINPFEYPGRSALLPQSTFGLLTAFIVLALLIAAMCWSGLVLSGATRFKIWFGRFALSLLPISIAFHAAHYLTELLVNGQYLLKALFGGDHHVTTSFLNTRGGSLTIFTVQTSLIVLGHIISIALAHLMVLKAGLPAQQALRLELPLAILMVAFTAFGLWLLATPSVS